MVNRPGNKYRDNDNKQVEGEREKEKESKDLEKILWKIIVNAQDSECIKLLNGLLEKSNH